VITTTTHLAISGPFDLREIALMGFGHRDERAPGAKPGIGPFYSSLIVIRACGHADAPSLGEPRSRAAIQPAYGIDHEQSDAELLALAESWRPFRTWVSVMMRALAGSTSQ
jgi:DNA-3-methyladenine glycosylase II